MNHRKEDLDKIVDKHLGLFGSPPPQDVAGSRERILDRLRSRAANGTRPAVVHSTNWKWRLSAAAAAAAATLVLFAVLTQWHANRNAVYAVVDDAGGGIYRVEGGEALRSGERIEANETIRTNGGVGAVLKLADGSSIEMRSKSELFLEHAVDGVRIRLSHGSVIVNAATQRTGHLYVRTQDMTVSVVGTVFLVNAEEEGSRVAVLEGEVRVKQGETETSLRPGEQVKTNPNMESIPLKEELTWSRQAKVHVAMLEQTSTSAAAQPPKEDKVAFELEKIRPTGLPPGNVGRGGGGGGGVR